MKTKFTKCLVMGALAIGMSSTVMAEAKHVKSSHAGKYHPVAYSATEGDNSAIALLLVNDRGLAHGLTCTNKGQALFAAGDCSRVDGQVSGYEGMIAYDLSGVKFEDNVLTRTTLHIEQKKPKRKRASSGCVRLRESACSHRCRGHQSGPSKSDRPRNKNTYRIQVWRVRFARDPANKLHTLHQRRSYHRFRHM